MKQRIMVVLMAMALVFSLSSQALAGDADASGDDNGGNVALGLDNTNNNANNLSAAANAASDQQQEQSQQITGSGNSSNAGNASVVYTSPRNHITATPGISGSLASIQPIVADGGWHLLLCDQYTIGELKRMKDSSSYANREGFYLANLFSSPLEKTLRVGKYTGKIDDNTVVRLVPDDPGNKIVAEYEGNGAKQTPLSAIVAYAGLEGVHDTGEYSMVVYYRVRDIARLSGLGIGSGAASSVSTGNSDSSKSLSVGAIIGFSEAYAKYVYDVKVKVVRASAGALAKAQCVASSSPPVVVAQPAPQTCNPQDLLQRIDFLKESAAHCKKECANNALLWKQIGDANMDLYYCTGDRNYLGEAIYAYERSVKNCLEGKEPDGTATRKMSSAKGLLYKVHYNWSLVIRERDGRDNQIPFAQKHGLSNKGSKDMPSVHADLKR